MRQWPRKPECWYVADGLLCDGLLAWDPQACWWVCPQGHQLRGRHEPTFEIDAAIRVSQDARAARRLRGGRR